MKIISYDRNMAEGGANYNAEASMLTGNDKIVIQPFSGGGYGAIQDVEREMYESTAEMETMEGGARGIVDGFESFSNAQELSDVMFTLGLAKKSTIGKNKIDEAQVELFMTKFRNIDLGMVKSDYLQVTGPNTEESEFNAARGRRAAAQEQAVAAPLGSAAANGTGVELPINNQGQLGVTFQPATQAIRHTLGSAAANGTGVELPINNQGQLGVTFQPATQYTGGEGEKEEERNGEYIGGAVNISYLITFLNTFKAITNNFTNFLFLYDINNQNLNENTILFITAFRDYLEEAVKADKLPDWVKYSKDAQKVQMLVNQPGMETYKQQFDADVAKLAATDPIKQSLQEYEKNKAKAYLAVVEQNVRTLKGFIQSTPTTQFAGKLNIFTKQDFELLEEYGEESQVKFDIPPPGNLESEEKQATWENGVSPLIAFDEYTKYISDIITPGLPAQQINGAIDNCLSIINQYIARLEQFIIPKLREVANTGIFHKISSKVQNSMNAMRRSAVFEGRTANLAKLGRNSAASVVAVPSEVGAVAQRAASATGSAIGSAASATGQAATRLGQGIGAIGRQAADATASGLTAAREAASVLGSPFGPGSSFGPGFNSVVPTGSHGGSRRRTIRSNK